METKKINQNQNISENLLSLLAKKVTRISKRSSLSQLKLNDLKEIKDLDVVLGVYQVRTENEEFLVHKIFVYSDRLIKGAYKQYNIIANALLTKNQGKEKISPKVNIYNNSNNEKFYNTVIEFVQNKINVENVSPGEYILQGLQLGDLLEVEI